MTELAERNGIVRAMLVDLDRHSEGERAHAERVAVYSVATGCELGIEGDALLLLRYAAQLHDVGKARISANMLRKIGQLEESELLELRLHAALAMEVIGGFDFLRGALPIIRHHHERWDGRGYPDGLIGVSIPLGARIVGLCEAFDVMTMPSGYRAKMPEAVALDEVRSESGGQFDPEVVEAFLKVQPIIQPIGL